MKRKFAIPTEGKLLAGHFGHASLFTFIETEEGVITKVETLTPPEHRPGTIPKWVAECQSTDIIVSGMGQHASDIFVKKGIQVLAGAPRQTPQALVEAYLAGKLNLDSNSCNHDHHNHDHHNHDHHNHDHHNHDHDHQNGHHHDHDHHHGQHHDNDHQHRHHQH